MSKDTIRVFFKDGNKDVIPSKLYNDYEYHDGWFIVNLNDKHVASYNMDDVAKVAVGKVEKEWCNKKGIKLFFRDYKKAIIPKKRYTDAEYFDGLFVVKRKQQWIALYSKDLLTAVVHG